MSVVFWGVIAFGLVFAAITIAAHHARGIAPPRMVTLDGPLPATPMERVVGRSLMLGLVPLVIAAAIVIWVGPTEYVEQDAARLSVTALLIGGLVVLAVPTFLVSLWSARQDPRLDERDRAILTRAPTSQAPAIIVLLAVWMIALQEGFRGEPGIPGVLLNLMFWSIVLVAFVASHVATLIGYRRG
jgi:hypothetical protein